MLSSAQIRRDFLEFFRERAHEVVASSPVVPRDDPTLLFANAGMNQFKDVFLGEGTRPYARAASTQKCLRVSGKHNDLDEVGRDTYHHTLFEMLGNWSFGDYYKAEAIEWAWELLTKVWGLPKEKLYATVFGGDEDVAFDEEAYELWRTKTDIDPTHILRFGRKDNFWEMGDTGPCGPCTEIHIDRGDSFGPMDPRTCFVNTDSARFIELWNLVFIQYHRDGQGKLHPLPAKHVDTGAGFERLCAVLQGKASNYDTDVFAPIIARVAELSGVPYTEAGGTPHRVIADHVRALSFAIADGAQPSNEGRGYVLRRILRRAARFGRELGLEGPFLGELAATLAAQMGGAFPELPAKLAHVRHVLEGEETSFGQTLDRGLDLFTRLKDELKAKGETRVGGAEAFRLYDTFGFPLDLTQQMAAEQGLTVDAAGFDEEMARQRSASRDARKSTRRRERAPWNEVAAGTSQFVGYDTLETATTILRWREGEEGEIELVLAQTPFYGESGGQTGDRGRVEGDGWCLLVSDTRVEDGARVHAGSVKGAFKPGDLVTARVETDLRRATERNHTATHLLHSALRRVLGEHVQQEGSLVEAGRLRFDFSHTAKLEPSELERVEKLVYEQVLLNRPVSIGEMAYDDAIQSGAMALFGEKYGDLVRVVKCQDFSTELCGGTHVASTGQIGAFAIVAESSIAAGVRRIEAVTGTQAQLLLQEQRRSLDRLKAILGSHGGDEAETLEKTLAEKKALQKELERLKGQLAAQAAREALAGAETVGGARLHAQRVDGADMDGLKALCDKLKQEPGELAALLASEHEGKAVLAVYVSDGLVKRGVKAGDLVREIAPIVGGGGGGRPQLATAGGREPEKLDEALEAFRVRVRALLGAAS